MSEIRALIGSVLSAQTDEEIKMAVKALRKWKDKQTERNDQVLIAALIIILFDKGARAQGLAIASLMQKHNYPIRFNAQQKKELIALTPTWVIGHLDNNTQGELKRRDNVRGGPAGLLYLGLVFILDSVVFFYVAPLLGVGSLITGVTFIAIAAVYFIWADRLDDLLKQEIFHAFGRQKLLLDDNDVHHADTLENGQGLVGLRIQPLIEAVLLAEHAADKKDSYVKAMRALNLWGIQQEKRNDQVFIAKLMTILFHEGAQQQVLSVASLMVRYNYPQTFTSQQKEELMALIPPRLICAFNPSSDTQKKLAKLPEEFSGFWSKFFVSVSWGIVVSSLVPCFAAPIIGGPYVALLAVAVCLVAGATCLVAHLLVREKWVLSRREDLLKREAFKHFGPQEGLEGAVPGVMITERPESPGPSSGYYYPNLFNKPPDYDGKPSAPLLINGSDSEFRPPPSPPPYS